MQPLTADQLRNVFTGYFTDREHVEIPSASLIPHDPTVLFTVAGMVPLKPYFLGEELPPGPRATSVQKCVRAGGKHNDLSEIGHTSRHLTFFEMLGNFSFGDYFKAGAIDKAWDLVTKVLGIDVERLWITVHTDDDEAEQLWLAQGVAPERIQRFDADNWWSMGDTGPCGPCSELFFDRGPEYGPEGGPLADTEAGERYIEFYNLVFMQFDQQPDGTRVPLPRPCVDTGMGLERTLTLLQDVDSVYELDHLLPLLERAAEVTGTTVGADPERDLALRIFADHGRCVTMLVGDGVFPSNEGRGYVLRRILRRAVRYAYVLGVERPVMPAMVDKVVEVLAGAYPSLVESHGFIRGVIAREEENFLKTLRRGSAILDDELAKLGEGEALPGSVAFLLHDTYGFPVELTEEITEERGVAVDHDGFKVEMDAQRARAKADQKARGGDDDANAQAYKDLVEQFGSTVFTGYDEERTDGVRILAVIEGDDTAELFCDRTPFYAESGGQVGDTGTITTSTGVATVIDTTSARAGLTRHVVRIAGDVTPGQTAVAEIDHERRDAIRRNHTGTHILHWALREVLGDHVKQQGSLVAPDRLRFDFSHYAGLTDDEITQIEDLANREILGDRDVTATEMDKSEALEKGAIAFFGDKYGDRVRVLEAGEHSVEFCGGTHVAALGCIGPVRIVSEGSIGSNIRRLEAVTGFNTVDRLRSVEARVGSAAELLQTSPDELEATIARKLDELKTARAEIKALKQQAAGAGAGAMADGAVDGVVVARLDGTPTPDEVRELALAVRDQSGIRAVVLAGITPKGTVTLIAAVDPASGLKANELIADAAKHVQGGGSPHPEVSQAGGKNPDGIDAALAAARAAAGV